MDIQMKELQVYSTIAGELSKLVHKKIPICFVPYNQAKEMQYKIKELEKQLEEKK